MMAHTRPSLHRGRATRTSKDVSERGGPGAQDDAQYDDSGGGVVSRTPSHIILRSHVGASLELVQTSGCRGGRRVCIVVGGGRVVAADHGSDARAVVIRGSGEVVDGV